MSVTAYVRARLSVLLPVVGLILILASACEDGGDGSPTRGGDETPSGTTPSAGETSTPSGGEVEISMVPILKFDKAELTVGEGEVTVTANNTDTGNRHNFAVFLSEADAMAGGEPIAKTEICEAPCVESVTFDTPAPGEYFFRCQVHPTRGAGVFIVE